MQFLIELSGWEKVGNRKGKDGESSVLLAKGESIEEILLTSAIWSFQAFISKNASLSVVINNTPNSRSSLAFSTRLSLPSTFAAAAAK